MNKLICFVLMVLLSYSCIEGPNGDIRNKQIQTLAEVRCYRFKVSSLRIYKEKGIIFKDKVTGYYDGHVDIGIASEKDITMSVSEDRKTANVEVFITILNNDKWYLDSQPTYIDGNGFTHEEMKELDEQANKEIFNKFIKADGITEAEKNLKGKLSHLLKNFGYENSNIIVHFNE